MITKDLKIPTIGIGAGPSCDGQVLVTHDILGFYDKFKPKFMKQYLDLSLLIRESLIQFRQEVESQHFPALPHSFSISQKEMENLRTQFSAPKNKN